jgi:thymidine phosphorylase
MPAPPTPPELIGRKRDGAALAHAEIDAFVDGVARGTWSEGQVAAMAMAIVCRGMDTAETVALTEAMTRSGERLDWRDAGLAGPVLDKHSTGGVGDKTSLVLAPLVAACGGVVPMVSGRGLAHTGGTLDKLEALPGYDTTPPHARLLGALREAGCAIVGASQTLAPADRRLYAIRDVTATVESVPLITASILSKKLAAGLQALVMDVKVGSGAFCRTDDEADALARSIVRTACGAGLPTVALVTDMDQVLGTTAGNALEVREAIALLTGRADAAIGDATDVTTGDASDGAADAAGRTRLRELTLHLAGTLLVLGGIDATPAAARARAERALAEGSAAERFARMVAALGGPRDVLRDARLSAAPVQRDVHAPVDGILVAMDTRAVGLAVVALGGGRRRPGEAVDPRVGFSHLRSLGTRVRAGEPLARVHAADEAAAEEAACAFAAASRIEPAGAADKAGMPRPVVRRLVTNDG